MTSYDYSFLAPSHPSSQQTDHLHPQPHPPPHHQHDQQRSALRAQRAAAVLSADALSADVRPGDGRNIPEKFPLRLSTRHN